MAVRSNSMTASEPADRGFRDWIERPLSPRRFLALALMLVAGGSGYCLLFCAIAFPLHGSHMPPQVALAWAVAALLPWLCCFEFCKRLAGALHRPALGLLLAVAAFHAAALASILLEPMLDRLIAAGETRPLSLQVAAQLPAALLTMAALLFSRRASAGDGAGDAEKATPRDSLQAILANPAEIDWIQAAGNYVEIHRGRQSKMHRVTMRELEAALDPTLFVRVHRSIIVNRRRTQSLALKSGSLRLADGTVLKIGSRYRRDASRLSPER